MDKEDSLQPLRDPLAALIQWLSNCGLPFVIIGGVAASLLGRPRATRDIDVMVLADEDLWEDFLQSGLDAGFEPRIDKVLPFARRNRVLLLKHRQSQVQIDISFGMLPFEEQMANNARYLHAAGLEIPLPRPEELIVMKGLSQRPRDISDIESLLDAHPNIDLTTVTSTLREFSEALEMPEILEGFEKILGQRKTAKERIKKIKRLK